MSVTVRSFINVPISFELSGCTYKPKNGPQAQETIVKMLVMYPAFETLML